MRRGGPAATCAPGTKRCNLRSMNDSNAPRTELALGTGEVPDANPTQALMDELPAEAPPLLIGAPFAISHECDLLDASEGAPGCVAVVRCECTQVFKFNLLLAGTKRCPKCREAYTHLLLIARADDKEIVGEAMAQVLGANGYTVPGGDDEGDEDDEDDDDDDGQGDNEG